MACSSGCCGPPAAASFDGKAPPLTPKHENKDSCCGDVSSMPQTNPDLTVSTPCQDKCCDGQSEEPQDNTRCKIGEAGLDDDCCAPNPTETGRNGGCCEGKPAPCCDQSCLDRLALRECGNHEPTLTTSHGLTGSHATSDCSRGNDGKPCADHIRKTRNMYAEKLKALGCICRALIALGQESCCNPQRGSSVESTHRHSREMPSRSRASVDSYCAASGAYKGGCSTKKRPGSRKGRHSRDGSGGSPRAAGKAGSCADSCCTERQPAGPVQKPMAISAEIVPVTDPEKGLSGNDKEHIIFSISGMTCTGCEIKLVRALSTYPSVRNLKTSLALSRAEFDLVGASSVVEVKKYLERTTEFKCERVTNRGSSLDLITPGGNAAAFINQPWPDGVTNMRILDKKIVNVSFDAKIIGARDLMERGWDNNSIRLAPLRPDPTFEAGSKHVRHVGYMTLLSACLTIPVLVMAWAPLPSHHIEYGSASLALATLIQFVIAGPFYPKALKAIIFSRVIEMDLLVVLSTSAAYIFSVVSFGYIVSGQPLSTGEFFETSTLLVTLIMVGRWVSALARQKAVESISVRSLQPPAACLVSNDGEIDIDARLLQYGDVFKVVPDSRIPTDGTVVSGSSEVDESMITGESRPVEKQIKSPLMAGSVNGSGVLHVRLTRLPGDNSINTIASMIDEAKLSKPKIQDNADRVASYFVPVVIVITIFTFCIWMAIGVKVRGQTGSEATTQAIAYAITVLVVSCPCAIGLAVPMVIVIASGVAAERGVIFKSAESLEVAYKTSHVVLDKTGTITEGKLTVAREWYSGSDQNATQSLLLGLLRNIKHPVSTAVVRHLKTQGLTASEVSDTKTLAGKGVKGTAKGTGFTLQAGNSRWLNLTSDAVVQSVLSQGYTAFCFTIGGSVAAIFGLEDSIRPDAASTVKTLVDRGISVHIISGDDDGVVRSIAAQLNIAETNIRSRCTPADKQAYIQDLLKCPASPNDTTTKSKKTKKPVVIFCGDGTNDAVGLAQATIGVHMNEGGTDVAQSAADVVLMHPNLGGVLTAITVSKKSMHRIAFNFGWSFVYNIFAILLATGAFVNARIPPKFAGLGELVSVLPVIAAAMLLRWSKI